MYLKDFFIWPLNFSNFFLYSYWSQINWNQLLWRKVGNWQSYLWSHHQKMHPFQSQVSSLGFHDINILLVLLLVHWLFILNVLCLICLNSASIQGSDTDYLSFYLVPKFKCNVYVVDSKIYTLSCFSYHLEW